MARLVHAQALDIGEVHHPRAHPGHNVRDHGRLQPDVGRFGTDPDPVQHVGQLHPVPGDHHRPRLDAPEPVDPVLRIEPPHQIGKRVGPGVVHHPVDLDRPGLKLHRAGIVGGVGLAHAELVEVIVGRDLLVGVQLEAVLREARLRGRAPRGDRAQRRAARGDDLSPVQPRRLRRHVRVPQIVPPPMRHRSPPPSLSYRTSPHRGQFPTPHLGRSRKRSKNRLALGPRHGTEGRDSAVHSCRTRNKLRPTCVLVSMPKNQLGIRTTIGALLRNSV